MDGPRFRRLMDVLGEAMLLPPADRPGFVERACDGDADLAAEARALLAQAEATSFRDVTERLVSAMDRAAGPLREARGGHPAQIGPYRILGVLGEGGMGVVYHAEQTSPIRRQVALKVVRGGLLGVGARARFEAERQALAVMSHPGIARIYDAGAAEDGLPYFAMELVLGEPITEYCDGQELDLDDRLELFMQVCSAVQHAHLSGVIHRDLKPSNILVGRIDGVAQARVIDFGIAKAVADTAEGGPARTAFGSVIGTLEYMSPEQAMGGATAVDMRADVYSLGVVLYELATGALPLDSAALRSAGVVEVQRLIRETPPPTPANAVSTTGERDRIARSRGTDPRSLERRLSGDLGWVIMKALEKDPGRRYQSAGDLAADLQRLRRSEPVEAGPPTRRYRAGRFVRRHRVGVLAASAVLVALLMGIAVATTGLVRARRAQLRAETEAERATLIKDFLTGMLAGARPENALGREVTVMEIVDSTAARIDRDSVFAEEPLVLADVVHAIGETYRALDESERSIALFERAVALKRSAPGDNRANVLISLNKLAEAQTGMGDLFGAIRTQEQVVALSEEILGREDPSYAARLSNLANMYADAGDLVRAERLTREALELDRRTSGDDRVSVRINNLATILVDLERCEEAVPLHEESLALRRRAHGEPSTEVAIALGNYALALRCSSRYAEAEAAAAAALPMAISLWGPAHQQTAVMRMRLAEVLLHTGRANEAEPLVREAVATYAAIDPLYFRTGGARALLGEALLALGRGAEGIEELEAGYQILARTTDPGMPRLARIASLIEDYHERSGPAPVGR